MYCKLFASLYQGTLRGKSDEILVFTNLIAHCGKDGTVDKHFRAIAEETGLSIDAVKAAITVLESPDEESRSPEEDGARIVKLDEHRVWGWRVVNYGKYRAIRSEDDRAEQNRLAQQRWRERHNKSKPASAASKQDKPKEREKDKEKQEERVTRTREELEQWTERIRRAYPRQGAQQDCRHAIRTALDAAHQTPEQILADVEECAKWVKVLEPTIDDACAWVPAAESFFGRRQWTDPKKFQGMVQRQKEARNGKAVIPKGDVNDWHAEKAKWEKPATP